MVTPPEQERLTAAERDRLASLKPVDARWRYVAGRAALRELASDLLGISPDEIEIRSDQRGRPHIDPVEADVSISHTGDLVIVAMAVGALVGVDIERRDRAPLPPWRLWLSAAEATTVGAAAPRARDRLLLRLWTAKEATSKALGYGTALSFRELDVLGLEGGWSDGGAGSITWLAIVAEHVTALALLAAPDRAPTSA
jgi:4'-phosphopantetheinyl transferase